MPKTAATAKITARPTTKATATPTPDPKQRALSLAKSVAYDKYWGRQMMITYLQEQGFSEAEATYGADNSGIDWNKNVLTVNLSVIQKSGGSASMAYELLQTVGYTKEEATYAANHWDTIDFYQNAVNSAKEMLNTASYGRDDMLIYLRMLGYTADQADYAVNKLGLK